MNAKSPAMPNEGWIVTVNETELPAFVPYYTGNGRLGVRVGPLVLDWDGEARPLLPEHGWDFGGRHACGQRISVAACGCGGAAERGVEAVWHRVQRLHVARQQLPVLPHGRGGQPRRRDFL